MVDFWEVWQERATWYTSHPLENLDEAALAPLAEEAGMTPDALRAHLAQPHIEMSCPLCGQSSTHLVGCKGCGGDAWGWEFEAIYGEEATTELRTHLTQTLLEAGVEPERIVHATRHSYVLGGCLVCADCWRHLLRADPARSLRSNETCPLLFLGERSLEGEGWIPTAYLTALWAGQDWTTWRAAVEAAWCAAEEMPQTEWDAIAHWRRTLLTAALAPRRSAVGGLPSSRDADHP
jgi:hypothetical protein